MQDSLDVMRSEIGNQCSALRSGPLRNKNTKKDTRSIKQLQLDCKLSQLLLKANLHVKQNSHWKKGVAHRQAGVSTAADRGHYQQHCGARAWSLWHFLYFLFIFYSVCFKITNAL